MWPDRNMSNGKIGFGEEMNSAVKVKKSSKIKILKINSNDKPL